MKAWLNGGLVAADEALIPASDRGFLLGDGLFETLLVRHGRPQRLGAHLDRLRRGARVIGLDLLDIDFGAAMDALIAANALTEASLRLTVTRGSGPRGVLPPTSATPTILITMAPLGPPPPPAHLIIAASTRRNEKSPLATIKSLNYLDNIIARREAAAAGADDAVLLNTTDRVAETTVANLFAMFGDMLVTPPVSEGALPGVLRADILRWGASEQQITPQRLLEADAIFLTSSLGLRPIRRIGARDLPPIPPLLTELSQALASD